MEPSEPVRLGILSAANIANTVVAAAGHVENVRVDAVASRSPEKAQAFAKRHGIPRTCEYVQMITDPDLDALYIPLPTTLAAQWALHAASVGKHVLVDKPFESEGILQKICDAAAAEGVVFLDGTHFVHNNRTSQISDLLRQGRIGNVRDIVAAFTIPLDLTDDIRKDATLEPLGALGDLGWYCARAAVSFLGLKRTAVIKTVTCFGSVFEDAPKTVREAHGVVVFGDGSTLTFDCGFYKTVLRQRVEICGEKGAISLSDFVIPERQFDLPSVPEGTNNTTEFVLETERMDKNGRPQPCASEVVVVDEPKSTKGEMTQGACMVREFVRLIKEKDVKKQKHWNLQTVQTQRILDAMVKDCNQRLEIETKTKNGKE